VVTHGNSDSTPWIITAEVSMSDDMVLKTVEGRDSWFVILL
jgi:hypothetical protein